MIDYTAEPNVEEQSIRVPETGTPSLHIQLDSMELIDSAGFYWLS